MSDDRTLYLMFSPDFSSARLTFTNRVAVEDVLDRIAAGDGVGETAEDFGLSIWEVKMAMAADFDGAFGFGGRSRRKP